MSSKSKKRKPEMSLSKAVTIKDEYDVEVVY